MRKQSIPINIVVNNSVLSALSRDGRWQETCSTKNRSFSKGQDVPKRFSHWTDAVSMLFGFEMFICQIQLAFAK